MRARTLAITAALCAGGAAIAAAPASADSIVYAKHGNLFLTSPDGAKGYQVTFDGGYSSPSQADNGTIGALRGNKLVRMNRSGKQLNKPIDAMGSDINPGFGGPYEPRISPDGKRFAYWFFVQTSYHDYGDGYNYVDTGSMGTWTWADRFTDPTSQSEYSKLFTQGEWLTNDRLLGTMGFWKNMWTWKLGTGHGYTSGSAQWWFGLQDPPDQWGVPAYHWYDDPALSRNGKKLAMTDGGTATTADRNLYLAATHSPAWRGEPPYAETEVGEDEPFPRPTIQCQENTGGIVNPSWSTDGDTLAYGGPDGVHVINVPDSFACAQMHDRTLVSGGTEPAFGKADVNPAQAPHGGHAAGLGRISLHPSAFRAGHGTRVRFRLARGGRVKLVVKRAAGGRVKGSAVGRGRRGVNSLRFDGRMGGHKLRPGAYRLVLSSHGQTASAKFRILR
jgi:hypothetical protein